MILELFKVCVRYLIEICKVVDNPKIKGERGISEYIKIWTKQNANHHTVVTLTHFKFGAP